MTLPSYPLPELDQTIQETTRVLKLILSDEEFEKFLASLEVKKVDLIKHDEMFKMEIKGSDNWASDIFKRQLLSLRVPIPVSTALPVMMSPSRTHTDQLAHCSALLWAVGRMAAAMRTKLNVQGDGLEDLQQSEILSACRVPNRDTDRIKVYHDSRHAVLLYKGSAFCVDVLKDDNDLIPVQEIYDQVASVASYDGEFHPDICNYTGFERNIWSDIRSSFKGHAEKAVGLMESAIVIIILEDIDRPDDLQEAMDYIRLGGKGTSCMRYYDKILNIVVFKNGKHNMMFEHTVVDGMVMSMVAKLLHNVCDKTRVDTSSFTKRPVKILDFQIKQDTARAPLRYDHKMATFDYHSFSDIFTTLREERMFSPLVSFSLQLAILQTFDNLAYLMVTPTHVRHFKNGRSDPTYSITENSKKLLVSILNNADEDDILTKFVTALEEHRKMIKLTKFGKGIGPHIAEMRKRIGTSGNGLKFYLEKFSTPEIYLTGTEFLEEVECAVGNVYASNQIAVGYVGKKNRINITMSATGLFERKLEKLKENFQSSLHLIMKIASRAAIASQMGVLHLFKSKRPFYKKTEKKFSIAIHGGAGEEFLVHQDVKEVIAFALRTALAVGVEELDKGKNSVDAVEAAVTALENCFLFNAGRGAVYNHHGTHELEASIMDGKTELSGSVACLTNIKNPIKAARYVMEKSPHALISGKSDKLSLIEDNFAAVDNGYFDTDIRYKQLMSVINQPNGIVKHPQTVGAVALDSNGNLAAASSTGGIVNKQSGRIGDTAIVGAGLFADKNIAVACTGDGEVFLRKSIASKISALCKYMHFPLQKACRTIIQDELKQSYGGVIGVDSDGNIVIESNAKVMFSALYDGENFRVDFKNKNEPTEWVIYENDYIIAYLHSSPCTNGVTIIETKDKSKSDIFALSKQEFVKLMMNIQHVNNILCERLVVQRCALVVEPQGEKFTKILLIPLHGLCETWETCICQEPEFNSCYPGHCSSKNGPRASDEDLNAVQNKIRSKLESQDTSFTYFGERNDDNLFARIVKGEEKAQWRVWEDEQHVAFLTPFPNTPGFTVLVPRKHLNSNIFALEKGDYKDLMIATHKVSHLLKDALAAESCAMIFEGYEIDYAHVKLIPLVNRREISDKSKQTDFNHSYVGYVTSQDGPCANVLDLSAIHSKLVSVVAPSSWKTPEQHSITAITHPWYSAIFKLQNTLHYSTVEFFHQRNQYSYVMTPLTTDTISSPMGLGSDSEPVQINLMNQNVYLADSMQFCLEYFLRLHDNLPGTYYISPSFRGENPDSSHLNQFYHVECELLGCMDDGITIAEQYLYHITKKMLIDNRELIIQLAGTTDHIEQMLERLELTKCFPRITLDEALEQMPSENFIELIEEMRPELGKKLTRKGEQFLIEKHNGPVWLTEMDHLGVPFYQAYVEGSNLVKAKAADLLIGMGETLGLGERHETAQEVKDALAHHQVPEESYNWYINMREVKPLKTSGWGMGTERYLCWLLNHTDVRDMQIIPRLKDQKFLP